MNRGSCLCGDITWEIDTALNRMGYCHCSRCRKSRSAAHSAQLFSPIASFRWLRGEGRIRSFHLPESEYWTAFGPDRG